jgi:methylenetetrahydrofolate dehydrogenase (NADP+) / methenyltetrahydrofolate cyclohydrolase
MPRSQAKKGAHRAHASTAQGPRIIRNPSRQRQLTCETSQMDDMTPPKARLIDGKVIAQRLQQQIRAAIGELVSSGHRRPGLAVVLVGNDPASQIYVRKKRQACDEAGLISVAHQLPADTDEATLLALLRTLNADPSLDGILVQLPLPPQLHVRAVIEAIDPAKDIDGFHPYNIGRLLQREPLLRPCTPYGIIKMLQHVGVSLSGLEAVVVGASSSVGRPMALELLLAGATTTVCHTRTRDLESQVRRAELLIAAVGRPQMIPGDWIRPGAVVIDVGMNRLPSGKLVGDVDFAGAVPRASWITPVPGGVGPMTVAMLLSNTLDASRARQGVNQGVNQGIKSAG